MPILFWIILIILAHATVNATIYVGSKFNLKIDMWLHRNFILWVASTTITLICSTILLWMFAATMALNSVNTVLAFIFGS